MLQEISVIVYIRHSVISISVSKTFTLSYRIRGLWGYYYFQMTEEMRSYSFKRTHEMITLQCQDGDLKMPDFVIEFLPVGGSGANG